MKKGEAGAIAPASPLFVDVETMWFSLVDDEKQHDHDHEQSTSRHQQPAQV